MNKLIGIITTLLLSISFCFGQQKFEGIIKMQQETAAGVTYNITWFIKKDKIAFEINTLSDNSSLKMRFVPQPQKNNMLMIINNEDKKEIAPRDISGEIDLSNASITSRGNKTSPKFGKIELLTIQTPDVSTEVEVTKEIDVDLSKYATYLKNDYGIQALIQAKEIGFPLNSTTKDKTGVVISKTIVKTMKRQSVSDQYFQ